jgi:septum formation topological specificity factor MinE
MFSNDAHVRVMATQREQEAQAAARRSQIIAARRRSKRKAEDTSRWIRRLLIAVR